MSEQIDLQVIQLWLERLRSGSEKERAQAASELSHLHIRTRGSVRTRAGLRHSARGEFPSELSQDAMRIVLAALRDESPAVRREAAFALGEWGNEEAATILCEQVVTTLQRIRDKESEKEHIRRMAESALTPLAE